MKAALSDIEYQALSPQQTRAYDALKGGRGLSNLLALTNHGIGSLSSRVAELRKKGLNILSEPRQDTTGKTYVVYRLPQEGESA